LLRIVFLLMPFFKGNKISNFGKFFIMNKGFAILILLHLGIGILAPTWALFVEHSIQESVSLLTTEKDIEGEEVEIDETLLLPNNLNKESLLNEISHFTHWYQNFYQSEFVVRFSVPPQTRV
jgi:hypothetical protein